MPQQPIKSSRTRPARRDAPARSPAGGLRTTATEYIGKSGQVDVDRVARFLRLSKVQLAETAGLGRDTFQKAARSTAPKAQSRITEMLEIIGRIQDWAGGETQALAWYRAQPIPALGGRTAEALVKSGEAGLVRDWLDHIALGGFA